MREEGMSGKSNPATETRPWKLAVLYLLFLAPFFFLTYNFANWLASQKPQVAHIVFEWEHYIPFLPWTIIPYWSIDLLYGISLFICTSKVEVHSLGKQLITCQVIAVCCFILFPLAYTFDRPESSGLFGDLFMALSSFDLPFNQAPSLHIALLVILWVHFPRHLPKFLQWPFHIFCFLIAISVLTTYQHHFIDLPTGALLGWFCVWLWPVDGKNMLINRCVSSSESRDRRRLATYYFLAAATFTFLAFSVGSWALWLLWPAVSMVMVALIYLFIGSDGFQKSCDGKINTATQWLLFPYLLGAKINSRLWTRNINPVDQIVDGLWIGRFPSKADIKQNDYATVIDMTAEFSAPDLSGKDISWHCISNLDLLTPSSKKLQKVAKIIEQQKRQGPILVVCALGYSRSAIAVMAWLLIYRHAASVGEAIQLIKKQRPTIVLKNLARERLNEFPKDPEFSGKIRP